MKKLVIDKSKWARGNASLLRSKSTGMMCCLGFYALSEGYDECQIDNIGLPNYVATWVKEGGQLFCDCGKGGPDDGFYHPGDIRHCNTICLMLTKANDDEGIDDERRQRIIRRLFKKIGVKVSFKRGKP